MGVFNESFKPFQNGWEIFSDAVCNKLTDAGASFLRKYAGADLYIVCGDGGVGKSSYIKSITGEEVYIGSTLESGTRTTALVPTVISGKRCLFLDMPGFNTRDFDDWDIFYRLMTAMSVVQSYVQFRGVLYVNSFQGNRITPGAEKILKWLSLFCGLEYMPNVTIVTTMWDGLDADGIEEKLARIAKWEDGLLNPLIKNGARFYHHGLIQEGGKYRTLHFERAADERRMLARDYIATHYRDPTNLKLQIYVEIANGATIDTTQAGRWLKYGHASASTHIDGEAGSSDQSGAQGTDSGQSRTGETGSSSSFWTGFTWQDAKPWVELIIKAAKTYASSRSGSGFSPDFDSDFEYDPSFEGMDFFNDGDDFPDMPIPDPEHNSVCTFL